MAEAFPTICGKPLAWLASVLPMTSRRKPNSSVRERSKGQGKISIAVAGHYALDRSVKEDSRRFGGQTAKCRELRAWIDEQENIQPAYIDTEGWRRRPIRLLVECLRAARKSEVVILALSENGLRMLLPLFQKLKPVYGFRLGYDVIGGWVSKRCKEDDRFRARLGKLDAIFAETMTMTEDLRRCGLRNVTYVPNAKKLRVLERPSSIHADKMPLSVCTFSRVCREKGITIAIEAVANINRDANEKILFLDVYGPIDPEYEQEFSALLDRHKDEVAYKGFVNSSESVDVLKQYLLLLLPTRYYGEGFPGTIVDAFSAGLPVVTSDWRNARSIIENGATGFLYDFDDAEGAQKTLAACVREVEKVISMRQRCLEEARKYTPEVANAPILDFIVGNRKQS